MGRFRWIYQLRIVIVAILTTLIICTCSQIPQPPLRIGTLLWPGYEPLHLASELGYFGSSTVQLVEYSLDVEQNRAFRNGEIDIIASTMSEALTLAESNRNLRSLLVLDVSDGADAIIAQPDINNAEQLQGRRIAIEPSPLSVFMLTRTLETADLTWEDVEIVQMEVQDQPTAFTRGNIDAMVTYEPVRSKLLANGANLIFDSSQIPGEIVDVLVGHKKLLNSHPQQMKVLVQGWFRALNYIQKYPEDAARRMAKRQGISTEQFLQSLEGLRFVSPRENQQWLSKSDPQLFNGAKRLAQFLVEKELTQNLVDPSSLLTDELVKNYSLVETAYE